MDFQKGDRVRLTDAAVRDNEGRPQLLSRFGVVAGYADAPYEAWVDVIFDGFKGGHNGTDPDENAVGHWFVPREDLSLVKAAKRPRPSIASDLKLKPQSKTVLRYLEAHGEISPMKALVVYGISRLAACIHDIREAGYKVSTKQCRDAQGHKYAQYALVK